MTLTLIAINKYPLDKGATMTEHIFCSARHVDRAGKVLVTWQLAQNLLRASQFEKISVTQPIAFFAPVSQGVSAFGALLIHNEQIRQEAPLRFPRVFCIQLLNPDGSF